VSDDENFASAGAVVRRHALQLFEAQREFINGVTYQLARVQSLAGLLQSEGLSIETVEEILRAASRSHVFPFASVTREFPIA